MVAATRVGDLNLTDSPSPIAAPVAMRHVRRTSDGSSFIQALEAQATRAPSAEAGACCPRPVMPTTPIAANSPAPSPVLPPLPTWPTTHATPGPKALAVPLPQTPALTQASSTPSPQPSTPTLVTVAPTLSSTTQVSLVQPVQMPPPRAPSPQAGPKPKLTIWQWLWQGIVRFFATLFGSGRSVMAPVGRAASPEDKTRPNVLSCYGVPFKVTWRTDEKGEPTVDYDSELNKAHNRALFITHTKKLLGEGGLQGTSVILDAAADLYQAQIKVYTQDAAGETYKLFENYPRALDASLNEQVGETSDAQTTTSIGPLQRRFIHLRWLEIARGHSAGPQGHYQVLTDIEPQSPCMLRAHAKEVGGEGECLYMSLAYALDLPEVRRIRADYDALPAGSQKPKSYIGYFKSQAESLLRDMHEAVGATLLGEQYHSGIDLEVNDMIRDEVRARDKRS